MTHKCPICKKPTATETHPEFPFCSERCKLHDLGNWATEKYTISEPAFDDSLFDDSVSRTPHGEGRDHKDDRKN
jgi:uncharacterized protein